MKINNMFVVIIALSSSVVMCSMNKQVGKTREDTLRQIYEGLKKNQIAAEERAKSKRQKEATERERVRKQEEAKERERVISQKLTRFTGHNEEKISHMSQHVSAFSQKDKYQARLDRNELIYGEVVAAKPIKKAVE